MKYFLIFILFILSVSCNKEKKALEKELAKLPAKTTTGKNTIGCLINGKAWAGFVSFGWWNGTPVVEADISKDNIKTVSITGNYQPAEEDQKNDERLQMSIGNFKGTGTYSLVNKSNLPTKFDNDFGVYPGNPDFELDASSKNQIRITAYKTNPNVLSGTFQLTLKSPASPTALVITEGRFDTTYY